MAEQYDTIIPFLDELNSAAPSVQAAAYQLILNRRIGQYVLPDNVVIIALVTVRQTKVSLIECLSHLRIVSYTLSFV